MGLPFSPKARGSAGITSRGAVGWSPSAMSAPCVPGASARMPATTEPAWPASGCAFTTNLTASPSSAVSRSECDGPTTTRISSSPTEARHSTVRRITGLPPQSSRSFAWPMRRDRPAARTMPAITAEKESPADPSIRGARKSETGLLLRGGLDGALGEDLQQVRLVLHRALQVGLDVHAVGRLLGSRLDRRRIKRLPQEGSLHAPGADRLGAGARDADARLAHLAALHGECRGDPDHREARGRVRELHVCAAHVGAANRNADLGEDRSEERRVGK